MAKISGVASQLSGKVGQLIYRQTKYGTVVYEAPAKASVPQRTEAQMQVRTQFLYVDSSVLAAYQGSQAMEASANSYGGINKSAVYLQPKGGNVVGAVTPVTPSGGGATESGSGGSGGGDDEPGGDDH